MELRKNILSAILLAVGFILHQIIPTFGGVTFDIQLAMLFVIIAINMDLKNTVVASLASGIITALTTKFPGGQLPNMIDKFITGFAIYLILTLLTKMLEKGNMKVANMQISVIIAGLLGTLISGTIFLTSALLIVGLPLPFGTLFLGVVLPTALANTIITPVLYNVITFSKKAAKLEF